MSTKLATVRVTVHHKLPAWELWLVRHKRLLEIIGGVIVMAALLSVVVQLAYPADRVLPGMQLGGLDVGGKDRAAFITQLTDYAQKGEVTVASPSRMWKAKWQSIGLAIDAQASAELALSYTAWERLIPFSGLIRVSQSHQLPLLALVDQDRLAAFSAQLVAEDKQAAQDASIHIKDGQVVIDEAKNGYVFTIEDVHMQMQTATAVSVGTVLRLVPQEVPVNRPTIQLHDAQTAAEAALAHKIVIKIGD